MLLNRSTSEAGHSGSLSLQLRRNRAGVKTDWQFTMTDARIKLRKLYPTVEG